MSLLRACGLFLSISLSLSRSRSTEEKKMRKAKTIANLETKNLRIEKHR